MKGPALTGMGMYASAAKCQWILSAVLQFKQSSENFLKTTLLFPLFFVDEKSKG